MKQELIGGVNEMAKSRNCPDCDDYIPLDIGLVLDTDNGRLVIYYCPVCYTEVSEINPYLDKN